MQRLLPQVLSRFFEVTAICDSVDLFWKGISGFFFLCLDVADLCGNGSKWRLFVRAFGKRSFVSHASNVSFIWIHCWLLSLALFSICLGNVYCVSSRDLLWRVRKLFIPPGQWKIKVRSRIKLLKHKCLVLFGLLQGIIQERMTFLVSIFSTTSSKWMSCLLLHGQLGQLQVSADYK